MKRDSVMERQSIFAATLAGAAPTMCRPAPQGAVRRHVLDDDAPPARTVTGRPSGRQDSRPTSAANQESPREFTPADKALIRKVHGYMSASQLLGILNERQACDLGANVPPYTIDQLRTEIASLVGAVPAGDNDWASLRKLLARAKRDKILDGITEQVINDFAVVFSLNQKQLLHLKDIILESQEDA